MHENIICGYQFSSLCSVLDSESVFLRIGQLYAPLTFSNSVFTCLFPPSLFLRVFSRTNLLRWFSLNTIINREPLQPLVTAYLSIRSTGHLILISENTNYLITYETLAFGFLYRSTQCAKFEVNRHCVLCCIFQFQR